MSTPYRNEDDALRERKAALEAELASLRNQTTRLDELRAREAELANELLTVDGRLEAGNPARRPLPLLDQVRVASPCKAEWNEMLGDGRVRYCLGCEKNVYNLSAMTKDDAEALLRERLGNELCIRFYQRGDGTILTEDCPVGVKKKRRKKLALVVAGAGAMAAAAATLTLETTCRTTMGARGPTAGAVVAPPEAQDETPVVQDETHVAPDDTGFRMGDTRYQPRLPASVEPQVKPRTPAMMGSAVPMRPRPPTQR